MEEQRVTSGARLGQNSRARPSRRAVTTARLHNDRFRHFDSLIETALNSLCPSDLQPSFSRRLCVPFDVTCRCGGPRRPHNDLYRRTRLLFARAELWDSCSRPSGERAQLPKSLLLSRDSTRMWR